MDPTCIHIKQSKRRTSANWVTPRKYLSDPFSRRTLSTQFPASRPGLLSFVFRRVLGTFVTPSPHLGATRFQRDFWSSCLLLPSDSLLGALLYAIVTVCRLPNRLLPGLATFLCSHANPPLSQTVHNTEALIGHIPMDNYGWEEQCGVTWSVKLLHTTCCTFYSPLPAPC
ncbi:hypothetical protein E2C01_090683 [Portunus trituberculatus]|uniref:Uncharacterized protein n=1 Tax=Portunus trituberculatus TaxID=210409 RepID=A0A5B7JKU4_PORTR|nr:hypothetical protein [Portunus trituberculatus]